MWDSGRAKKEKENAYHRILYHMDRPDSDLVFQFSEKCILSENINSRMGNIHGMILQIMWIGKQANR